MALQAASLCDKFLEKYAIDAAKEFREMILLGIKCSNPLPGMVTEEDIKRKDKAILDFFRAEGGLFAKIGQLIAQSATELTDDLRNQMRDLFTDASDPVPFAELEELLTDASQKMEPGVLNIADIKKDAIAVASIAQVHAVGHDKIAKVSLRRNQQRFTQQLEYLKKLASYKIFLSSGKDTLCQKIGESVLLEFAMNTEAEILMRASADIDKLGDQVHDVSVPKVLGFTREVLVMKRADGNHLVDLLPGGSKNKSQEEEEALKALKAQKIVRNLFKYQGASVFKSGMVHCDPHAGNILVDSDGHITVLDWGCVADLSDEEQKHLEVIFANLPHIKDAGHESKDVASSWGFLGGLCGPKSSTPSAPSAHQERCAHVASAMRQLGFKTKKNTPEGLTTIALQSFDSSEPPSLKRVEDGAFGLPGDRGNIEEVSNNIFLVMRMISLLGGLARDAGNDVQELNTLRLWSSHVEEVPTSCKRKSIDEGSEDATAPQSKRVRTASSSS